MFTLTDKVLLDRAARLIREEARSLLNAACPPGGWGATEASRKHKLVYDRLVRDERDLRALGKRLCLHFDVKADRSKPVPQDTAEVGDPLNALDPEARADYLSELGPGSNRDFSGLKFDVSRETSEGNPQLQAGPHGDTVEASQRTGEQDVGF